MFTYESELEIEIELIVKPCAGWGEVAMARRAALEISDGFGSHSSGEVRRRRFSRTGRRFRAANI